MTRDLAVDAGLNTQQLDGIVALGGYEYVGAPPSKRHVYRGKRQSNIYKGFDLTKFVDAAFKVLKSDVTLSTDVRIGDYATTIEFAQDGLPTLTDESLHLLLPILAQPIVQKIVSGSQLGSDQLQSFASSEALTLGQDLNRHDYRTCRALVQ